MKHLRQKLFRAAHIIAVVLLPAGGCTGAV